ncbi:MAG: glycosyltransferase [Lapillicoccus sp.]
MRDGGSISVARYVVVGPPTHGVVVHALRLAAADATLGRALVRVPTATSGVVPEGLLDAVPRGGAALLHVTDRLFGPTPEAAARAIQALGTRTSLALALHDVPQPAEGGDWYAQRRDCYGQLAGVAPRLVVASAFEADLLARCAAPEDRDAVVRRTRVIPLPVERRHVPAHARAARPGGATADLAVLGFLYPGKGVEDAIDVAAALTTSAREVTVTNYGAVAEGHADDAESLARYAAERGVRFRLTGYLSDEELLEAVLRADVPLAPHRHISASGSVNTWVEAGRRPLVRRSPYVDELAARLPGVVTAADDLQTAVAVALVDPTSTWLEDHVEVGPSWATTAAAYADVLRELR